ncbi:MAG: hypothetical protein D6795_04300 [Deltaproteobacteria bacterium]|nr:MAG: hypothetical protein D6795_04300 [Deltaproteobacteria bacterium]
MGSLSGTLTYRRYRVIGRPPEDFKERYSKELARHAFREVDSAIEKLRSAGWVTIRHLFDTDFSSPDRFLFNQYIRLVLRIDQLTIPAKLFSAYYTRRAEAYLAEHPEVERISRSLEEALKQKVREEIIRKGILPSTQAYELVWNLDSGRLFFFSTSKKANEEMIERFQQTFGLSLRFAHPLLLAYEFTEDASFEEAIEGLEPVVFSHPES